MAGLLIFHQQGYPNRFDKELLSVYEDVRWRGKKYESSSPSGVLMGVKANNTLLPDFVLWGDSHGMALADTINSIATDNGLCGSALLSSGCPPVPGLWKPLQGPDASRPRVARDFALTQKYPTLNGEDFKFDLEREKYERARKRELDIFMRFNDDYCSIIDPIGSFYSNGQDRLILYSERAYYRDEDHLSRSGAEHYMKKPLTDILTRIK